MAKYKTSDVTRKALIAAAGELFAAFGYDGVTTREIALKAKANIGNIHYHFGGKMGLLESIFEDGFTKQHLIKMVQYVRDVLPKLKTNEDKIEAVQHLTDLYNALAFDADRPLWHAPLLFQVIQHDWDVSHRMYRELILPILGCFERLYCAIAKKPSKAEAKLWSLTLCAPMIIFLSNPNAMTLGMGGRLPPHFHKILSDYSVKMGLIALGLVKVNE